MDDDLISLEKKLTQLIELCNTLRTENISLRQEFASSQAEINQLKRHMTQASERLQTMLERLPDAESMKEAG
jgi:cell division protein ZapB